MKIKALFYLSVVIFFTACRKEKIVEVEKIVEKPTEYKWKRIEIFSGFNTRVLNSFASEKYIYFLGSHFTTLDSNISNPLNLNSNIFEQTNNVFTKKFLFQLRA